MVVYLYEATLAIVICPLMFIIGIAVFWTTVLLMTHLAQNLHERFTRHRRRLYPVDTHRVA